MKKRYAIFGVLAITSVLFVLSVQAQSAPTGQVLPPFKVVSSTVITPRNASYTLQLPKFVSAPCLGTSASGTFIVGTCSGGSGGSSTVVLGVNGVTVTALVGGNQTSSLDVTFAASWSALETFLKGILINGTTTFASSTNCGMLTTNASGTIVCGSTPVLSVASSATISASASTGSGISFSLLQSYLTAAITSINGNTNAAQTFTAGSGVSVASAGGNTTTTNTGVTSFTGQNCVTSSNSTGTITLTVTCISGNQNITFTISGDATGTSSGTTSITDAITVTGLNNKALPANTTGTLYFTGNAWNLNTLPTSVGGTGITGTPSNGSILIGSSTVWTIGNLTPSGCITVTNATGTITVGSTCLSAALISFNGSTSSTINFNITTTGGATSTVATSGGTSTTTITVGAGAYMNIDAQNRLTASTTLASSTWTWNLKSATTTASTTNYGWVRTNVARTLTGFGCYDTAGTTTLNIFIPTGFATTTVSSTVNGSFACGIPGQTATANVSMAANSYIIVMVSSTAGTPVLTPIYFDTTKL